MKHVLLLIAVLFFTSLVLYANEAPKASNRVNFENTPILLSEASEDTNTDSKYSNSIIQKVEQGADSSTKNEIVSLYSQSQIQFFVKIELAKYNVEIKLLIFNMLGNLVKEAFVGIATKGVEYDFDASNLPNGLYLCILEGPNFRDAEKFTISR
jgi:hypothetical protein